MERGVLRDDGVRGDRPDRRGSGVLDSSQRSIDRWFDTSAFVAPVSRVNTFITDSQTSPEFLERLRKRGVNVIVANVGHNGSMP